jgi:hypothetical protein
MAIKFGRVHQTRLLLDIGTNPNVPDRDTKTSLMLACFIEKQNIGARIARMLIEKGAVVSAKDRSNRTALSYACINGKEKIVEMLLEDIEFDINAQDDEGNTPLMYAAMSGNATALRFVLEVLMKYRLSVDLRNIKGFSAYLLAAKMGHFFCAHILKTEGFASDGIRDTEYFLSDKEWIKKVRKDIARMQVKDSESRIIGSRSACSRSPRISLTTRPQTSFDYERTQSPSRHGPDVPHRHQPRAGSRLTTRSEPPRLLKNSWINIPEERSSHMSSTSSATSTTENSLMLVSESSDVTETVPSEARTKTPDLHAIFSHYLDTEVYKPVRIIPRKDINKNVKFSEDDKNVVGKSISPSPSRQRKQSRQGPKQKRGGLST